jgi:hypothetical protein
MEFAAHRLEGAEEVEHLHLAVALHLNRVEA